MQVINGQYNNAIIFTDNVEEAAFHQIKQLLDQEFVKELKIRIMPDCHAGAGCVIGTTMTIKDKVVPNLVGVDIGCGMLTVEIGKKEIDFKSLDKHIRKQIPVGMNVHEEEQKFSTDITKLRCWNNIGEFSPL